MFPGGFVSEGYGVDSDVGRLRAVLVHRPGAELRRLTPDHRCGMLFTSLPWAERAQAEHDAFAATVFAYHPLFAGTKRLFEPGQELLAGGDVLLLAPGVVAIGTGAQTSPAGLERLATRVFDSGLAHTVLAVLTDPRGTECLDVLCTVAAPDTVMMRPAVAYSLVARTITQAGDGLRLSHPQPFLGAAARAMGIDRLRVIETGLGSSRLSSGGPGWTGGPGAPAGQVPGGELAGCRGGPRAICCPVGRDPASMPDQPDRAA